MRPLSTLVRISTGQDHAVGGTVRPKIGVGIIAVGTAITSTVATAASTPTAHRRGVHWASAEITRRCY